MGDRARRIALLVSGGDPPGAVPHVAPEVGPRLPPPRAAPAPRRVNLTRELLESVSYTHLTLPTICSV
eukprot:13299455-Alexandrium_andersonii.AAC.1